ncbi:MAG: DUF1826 domain-containing protein [Henriciella sp.]
MIVSAQQTIPAISPVQIVQHRQDLDAIKLDGVEGVIWDRPIPHAIIPALNDWTIGMGEDVRQCMQPDQVEAFAASVFEAWGGLADIAKQWLAADIAQLARHLANILSAPRIQLRIERVTDNACRKFHKDMVRARMICTYAGPGTQFGYSAGDGAQPAHAETVATGAPILLKGKRWPLAPTGHVLHRSPPIEHLNLTRLVIVINEA